MSYWEKKIQLLGSRIILGLEKDINELGLSRKIDITYCALVKRVRVLEKMGVISTEKIGRQRIISITEKGLNVQQHLRGIRGCLS